MLTKILVSSLLLVFSTSILLPSQSFAANHEKKQQRLERKAARQAAKQQTTHNQKTKRNVVLDKKATKYSDHKSVRKITYNPETGKYNVRYRNKPYQGDNSTRQIPRQEKCQIDAWLRDYQAKGWVNQFGDPQNTMYAGGNPLFDYATGRSRNLYRYIVEQHPDAPWRSYPCNN
jgi:hypothetical protein